MADWGKVYYHTARKQWGVRGVLSKKQVFLYHYPTSGGLLKCSSRDMAVDLQKLISGEMRIGIFNIKRYRFQKPLHLRKYAESWLKLIKPDINRATHHDYQNSLNNHILPILGDKYLPDIVHDDLLYLMQNISRAPKGKKNVMGCLHKLMNDALKSGHIVQLPVWPEFRGKNRIPKPKFKAISQADQWVILNKIQLKHRPIFLFMMATGCRPSEARALRKVDIEDDYIFFTVTFGRGEELKEVKTGDPEPWPMTEEVKQILEDAPKSFSEYVFPNPTTGKPYSKNINKIWNRACQDAGVEYVKLNHATRHSFACQMLNGGLDKGQVSRLLRHTDPKTIEKYARYDMEPLKSAVDKVRRVRFGDGLKNKIQK